MLELIFISTMLGTILAPLFVLSLFAKQSSTLGECRYIIGAVAFFCLSIAKMGFLFIDGEQTKGLFSGTFYPGLYFTMAVMCSFIAIADIIKKKNKS